jgi:hypothetical protein
VEVAKGLLAQGGRAAAVAGGVDVAALIFGHEVSLASWSPQGKITTDVTDKERIRTDRAGRARLAPRFYFFPY